MTELEDILNAMGLEPHKRSKITKEEIPIIALGVATLKFNNSCVDLIEGYRELIMEGADKFKIDEWMKERINNGKYPSSLKEYTYANLDSRHSWDGWLTERKFGYGAVQSMGERGPEMLNITQPKEEEKKKHWWQRGEK